jgi:hypothetical protein
MGDGHRSIAAGGDFNQPGRDRHHDLAAQEAAWPVNMLCERCKVLALLYLGQSEAYIGALERQSEMFRNGETQFGRDLDRVIAAAKKAMLKSQRAWVEHQESHSNTTLA